MLSSLCRETEEKAAASPGCEQQPGRVGTAATPLLLAPGSTGDFLFALKVRLITKLSSLFILRLLYLASDIGTRTSLFPNLWELGKSKMLCFKAVCLVLDFCGLLTD